MAIQLLVGARERELEFLRVIEAGDFPHVAVVAIRARRSQATGMLVIRLVAADAILRDWILQISATVAIAAADSSVLAIEGKSSLPRVIELLRAPVGRVVAVGALRSLTALMHVIGHVAADALLRRSFVMLACVAGGAGNLAVLVGEREGRSLVVERVLLPGLGVMAGCALGSECTAMDVILAMAVDTG